MTKKIHSENNDYHSQISGSLYKIMIVRLITNLYFFKFKSGESITQSTIVNAQAKIIMKR